MGTRERQLAAESGQQAANVFEVGGALRFDLLTFALGWRQYKSFLTVLLPQTSNLQHLVCLLTPDS